MAGGLGRKEEASLVIKNSNVFAALETLKKKKKKPSSSSPSNMHKGSKSSSKSSSRVPKEPEPQVFWQPTPLNVKSWADVDDDEDDDYYATTAPPVSVWGNAPQSEEQNEHVEDTESDNDLLDEGEDEIDDEHDHEPEAPVTPEPVFKKVAEVPSAAKNTERQLSKKEQKKKELAELEALLVDFGVAPKESNGQDRSHEVSQDNKNNMLNDEGDKKENALGESRSAKKKKKKDKSLKETKELQGRPNNSDSLHGAEANGGDEKGEEGGVATVDIKEKLKKVASAKKKKSNKEMDAAAKVAAQEAAARNARLAAAKKKEKNHYNQQPVR